jgi:hypothetical protein
MQGTGLVVWAVWGWPSGVSIFSQLPWSAMTIMRPCGLHSGNHAPQAGVNHFAGVDRSLKNARMAHHVAIGEIADHKIVRAGIPGFHKFVRHFNGAHGRLLVVGFHLAGGRHKDAILTSKRLFKSAIEKVGDVRVFFRFRQAQLLQPLPGNHFAKPHAHGLLGKGHGDIEA